MTDELINRVAKAIWAADDTATEPSWGFVTMLRRGQYRHMAKAAIEEMK